MTHSMIQGNSASNEGDNVAANEEEVSHLNGMLFNQLNENAYFNQNWVLFNSESTDHILCIERLVS